MTTNAQAALQAAAALLAPVESATELNVLNQAETFKAWLDAQDKADDEARRKTKRDPSSHLMMEPGLPGRATSGISGSGIISGPGIVEAGSGIPRDGRDVIGRRIGRESANEHYGRQN